MSIITEILKEIPLSAVLKERLTEAESKMTILEKENSEHSRPISGKIRHFPLIFRGNRARRLET